MHGERHNVNAKDLEWFAVVDDVPDERWYVSASRSLATIGEVRKGLDARRCEQEGNSRDAYKNVQKRT